MKIQRLLCLAVIAVFLLSSCGAREDDSASASKFPVNPDKIIVGIDGMEKEIVSSDAAYNEIVAKVNEFVSKSENFGVASLDAQDPESGEHLSFALREKEAFIEFVYHECAPQTFAMVQAGGGTAAEDKMVQRIFFSLSGQYQSCYFVGQDDVYKSAITLGPLADNADLAAYVRDFLARNDAAE